MMDEVVDAALICNEDCGSDGDFNPFLNEFEEDVDHNEIDDDDDLPVGWDLPPDIVHN